MDTEAKKLAHDRKHANDVGNLRTYDEDGFRRRAGCVCFKTEEEKQVLLVSSMKRDIWVIPAGGVDKGEDFKEAAVREALEEAGVRGRVGRLVGYFQYDLSNYRLKLFALYVTEELQHPEWQEGTVRRRQWFPVSEAITMLTMKPYQQQFLIECLKTKDQPLPEPPPLLTVTM